MHNTMVNAVAFKSVGYSVFNKKSISNVLSDNCALKAFRAGSISLNA